MHSIKRLSVRKRLEGKEEKTMERRAKREGKRVFSAGFSGVIHNHSKKTESNAIEDFYEEDGDIRVVPAKRESHLQAFST